MFLSYITVKHLLWLFEHTNWKNISSLTMILELSFVTFNQERKNETFVLRSTGEVRTKYGEYGSLAFSPLPLTHLQVKPKQSLYEKDLDHRVNVFFIWLFVVNYLYNLDHRRRQNQYVGTVTTKIIHTIFVKRTFFIFMVLKPFFLRILCIFCETFILLIQVVKY